MTSYASVADVETVWGSPLDDVRTQALLDMGTDLINGYNALIQTLAPPPAMARIVNVNIVVRTLANPQGVRSEQLASYSTTYGDTSSGMSLIDDDREMLDSIPGVGSRGVYEVVTPTPLRALREQWLAQYPLDPPIGPLNPYVDPYVNVKP